MRRMVLGLLAGVLIAPPAMAAAPAATAAPIGYTSRTLANGLRVYAIRDANTATVSVNVWYDVGSKDDPAGRSGFAHMFEHLMFKATRNMPAETMDRLTEDVGGMNNASTDDDYTNYYEVVPANHLRRLLWAEAERMGSLVVDQASFASERDVVKEELRSSVLAQPYGRLFSLYLPMTTYQAAPYARPTIGSIADLDAATVDDIRAFHATYYRPDNAVLVVAGNFDPAELNRWVDAYFGPIKAPARPLPRVPTVEPARTAPRAYTVYEPNVPLPAVTLSWLVPPSRDKDGAALPVLNAILSGGESSRLYESLVYRDQVAQEADTYLDEKQGNGALVLYAIMAGGKDAATGEAALLREVARLRDAPVSAAELAEAKAQILTAVIRQRETPAGKATAIARAVVIDGDAEQANRDLPEIAAVTAADIQRVARRYLADSTRVTVRYLPREQQGGARGDTIALAPGVNPAALTVPADVPVVTAASAAERVAPPAPAAPVPVKVPVPFERRLANGLRLVVVEKHDVPLVSAQMLVSGGSAADPATRAGLASITASLLTKGTATRSATEIARDVEALGGSIGGDAGWDGAGLALTVTSDKLAPAMAIFADVALHPAFAQDELDRERAQEIDNLSVALKQPGTLARYVAARAVFGDGPYGHPSDGTPASLKAITRDDVAQAYAARWRPDAATLVLVGDVRPAEAEALAQRLFGGWRAPAAPLGPVPAPVAAPKPRLIVVDLPESGQAAVVVARQGLARSDLRYYPAIVANAVLGGGYSSRLNQEVRIRRGLSYGAGSGLDARRTAGPIVASAQTKNVSAPEVAELILAELDRMGTEPVAPGELTSRKAALTGGFARSIETTSGLAGQVTALASQDVPLAELSRYSASVETVDAAAVQAASAALLSPKAASVIVVGDAKDFLPALAAKGLKPEVIPAAQLNLGSAALK